MFHFSLVFVLTRVLKSLTVTGICYWIVDYLLGRCGFSFPFIYHLPFLPEIEHSLLAVSTENFLDMRLIHRNSTEIRQSVRTI